MDPSFARPAQALADSGIPNTFEPSPGKGLVLDPLGLAPLSTLARRIQSVSAAYTATASDDILLVSGTTTITLPFASGQGKTLVIKNAGGNTVTVSRQGTDTIEGATSLALPFKYQEVTLVSDGTSTWYALGLGRQLQYGLLAAVTSDAGGWLNYTITGFANSLDFVLAMNGFGGTSGAAFQDIQIQTKTTFRCFINAAAVTADAMYVAMGH